MNGNERTQTETEMNETKLAPNRYGNEYFNKMMAPIQLWPEITLVKLTYHNGAEKTVEIPTADVWVAGDWVARRYAATPYPIIEKWLWENGHSLQNVKLYGVINAPKIESA